MSAKERHDQLLAEKPEGANHPEDCPYCTADVEDDPTGGAGDSMSDKTYTSEELAAAIALAVKPLEDKIAELEAKDAEAEVEARIAEAKAESDAKIAELQTELDVKVAELEASKQEVEDINAYLAAEKAREEEEAAREERKAERLEQVEQHANYSEEYRTEHADRWASMSDEEFAALIDDLKAAGVKKAEEKDDSLPSDTKLHAASEKANKDNESSLSAVLELRRAGIDASRIK